MINASERLRSQRVEIENGVEIDVLEARVEIEIPDVVETRRNPATCGAHSFENLKMAFSY